MVPARWKRGDLSLLGNRKLDFLVRELILHLWSGTMKTIGTLKRANVQVRRHNERHAGRAFWLPAIALSLMASLATPAPGALIVNFSVTGTTSGGNWSGFFDIVDENLQIWQNTSVNINTIFAENQGQTVNVSFSPDDLIREPADDPPNPPGSFTSLDWFRSSPFTQLFFDFSSGGPEVNATWAGLVGQTFGLSDSSESGFTDFETLGGSVTFSSDSDPEVIPEPSTLAVASLFLGIGVFVMRRRRKS